MPFQAVCLSSPIHQKRERRRKLSRISSLHYPHDDQGYDGISHGSSKVIAINSPFIVPENLQGGSFADVLH
jgi:hypothetical protein